MVDPKPGQEEMHCSWDYIEHLTVNKLYKAIKNSKRKYTSIYGVPRGGLILAVRLSHLLGIPVLLDPAKIGSGTLIVDDINDTGKTIKNILINNTECDIAVLFERNTTEYSADFYGKLIETNHWLVFPWEVEVED